MWRDLKNNQTPQSSPNLKNKQKSGTQKFQKFKPEFLQDQPSKTKFRRQLSTSKLMANVRDRSQNQSFYQKKSVNLVNKGIQGNANISLLLQSPKSPKQNKKSVVERENKKKFPKLQLQKLSKNIKYVNYQMRIIMDDIKNLVHNIFAAMQKNYNQFISTFTNINQNQIFTKNNNGFNQNLALTFGHGELQSMKQKMGEIKQNLDQSLNIAQSKLQSLKINQQQSFRMIEIDSTQSPRKSRSKNKFSIDSKSNQDDDIPTDKKVVNKISKGEMSGTMHEITQRSPKQNDNSIKRMALKKSYSHTKLYLTNQNSGAQSKASLNIDKKLNSISQFKRFSQTLGKMKILMEQSQQI